MIAVFLPQNVHLLSFLGKKLEKGKKSSKEKSPIAQNQLCVTFSTFVPEKKLKSQYKLD